MYRRRRSSSFPSHDRTHICQGLTPAQPSEVDISVINNFPLRRLKAYREAQPKWDIGVTADMVEANNQVVETLLQILVDLARFGMCQ